MRPDGFAGYKCSPRTRASRPAVTSRWDGIHSTTSSTDDHQPAVEPSVAEPLHGWVDWVLDSVMADHPYPYAALLLPASEAPVTALRLAGERRDAGIGRLACDASTTENV